MTITHVNRQIITAGLLGKKQKKELGVVSTVCLSKAHGRKTLGEVIIPIHGSFKNRPERIIEILKVIDMEIDNGYTPLLIHCKNGQDRSPTIAALYLYYKGKFDDFDSALDFVKQKSDGQIEPKKMFLKFVKDEVIPALDSSMSTLKEAGSGKSRERRVSEASTPQMS